MRELADAVYVSMGQHRWIGNYLLHDSSMEPKSMRLFELFGAQLLGLPLTDRL